MAFSRDNAKFDKLLKDSFEMLHKIEKDRKKTILIKGVCEAIIRASETNGEVLVDEEMLRYIIEVLKESRTKTEEMIYSEQEKPKDAPVHDEKNESTLTDDEKEARK